MTNQTQVLLADRDPSRRAVLERTLRGQGYRVRTTIDGWDLLRHVEYLAAVEGRRVAGHVVTKSFAVVTSSDLEGLSGLAVRDCMERAGWQIPTLVLPDAACDERQIEAVRTRLLREVPPDAAVH